MMYSLRLLQQRIAHLFAGSLNSAGREGLYQDRRPVSAQEVDLSQIEDQEGGDSH